MRPGKCKKLQSSLVILVNNEHASAEILQFLRVRARQRREEEKKKGLSRLSSGVLD